MKNFLPQRFFKYLFTILLLVLACVMSADFYKVEAANLGTAMLRFSRMAASVNNTTVLVVVKPGASNTSTKVRVGLSTNSYSVDSNMSLITTSTTGVTTETLVNTAVCDLAMFLNGSIAYSVPGTSTVDFSITSTALSTSKNHCFYIIGGVGTGSTTGNSLQDKLETMNGATVNDTATVATSVVSSGSDQVTITATVPAIFTFALNGTTDSFQGGLSTARITSTAGIMATIGTNAQSGWEAWLKSTNGALTSAVTTGTIATDSGYNNGAPATLSNGTSKYVVDVLNVSGSGIDTEYAGAAPSNAQGGSVSSSALQRIAYSTAVASGDTFVVYGLAGVSATQKAATDYTDIWTIVGAGQF